MQLFHVDAFTKTPFSGNAAVVCLLTQAPSDAWMQAMAAEMNVSETAFVTLSDTHPLPLRWFTPEQEVPLCGHATLASAHVLWRHAGWRADQPIDFTTRSGVLRVSVRDELITMLFPSKQVAAAAMPGGLIDALNVTPRFCGVSDWFYLIELDDAQAVRAVQPDMAALKSHEKAVIVTAQAPDTPYDFVSRCFAPAAGIPEDPVTGSAHCTLAGYWFERLGKREFHAYQASSRGGELWLRYDGDRVAIAGYAVTVAQGLSLV